MDLFSLKGRVALVTGGSRGIGKMIAKGFIDQGAKVYVSSRKPLACDETAAELGPNCISLPQDVSTVEGCRALADRLNALEPKLDILVNNAGAAWGAPFDEFPESGWDKVMDLNLKSPFFLTQALHGALKAAASHEQPAKVINICSIDGIRLNPQETYSYHASKSGLIYLTRRMAAELVKDSINVTGIAPGAFASEMMDGMLSRMGDITKGFPRQRLGDPAQMDSTLVYLVSPASEFVTGTFIKIDDGQGGR